jgi:hypothetical protein
MVVPIYNPSTLETEKGGSKFKPSLGYIARLSQKEKSHIISEKGCFSRHWKVIFFKRKIK